MIRSRALYHMVRADFLERVRRYSFLLTLAFSVYLAYAVYAGQMVLKLDEYRGMDNSAWLGSVVGLVASMWLTLVGFYIVKNAIQRDRETRVGQILATTPIGKSFYTLSKTLSNFAVLAAMVLVLALGSIVIQLFHRADPHIDLIALVSPVLLLGLSAVAVTAALAVLFESLPVLRGGVGNILYVFLWIFLLVLGANGVVKGSGNYEVNPFIDFSGIVSVMSQMQKQVDSLDKDYSGGASFNIGGENPATKTFLWTGVKWTPALVLSRGMLFAAAVALALLAAFFFDRFDPARAGWFAAKKLKPARKTKALTAAQADILDGPLEETSIGLPQMHLSAAQLAPLPQAGSRTRFFTLVRAELLLLLRGHAWWWYTVAAGLIVASFAAPLDAARSGVIVFAWIWPALFWSQMGTREKQFSTGPLIYSAPHAVPRQLLATFAAGVLLAAITGGGLALRLFMMRDFAGLAAWGAGALFIPALALALGVASGSRKFFEALYTAWWYVGPLHHIRPLDFMGTTPASSTPVVYMAAAVLLVLAAYGWRRVRLAST
jgi:hypothetical protein